MTARRQLSAVSALRITGEPFAFRVTREVAKRTIDNIHCRFSSKTHQPRMPAASEEYPIYWEADGTLWGRKPALLKTLIQVDCIRTYVANPEAQYGRRTCKHTYLCWTAFRWLLDGPYVSTEEGDNSCNGRPPILHSHTPAESMYK